MDFMRLLWREPWLAPVVLNLRNIIPTERIETAGVTPDGKTLYYNPSFWDSLRAEEQLGLQLHEVLHIANLHAARKGSRQHWLWNVACDMAINYQIEASGYVLPKGGLTGENDTAEHIYARLLQKDSEAQRRRIRIYSGSYLRNGDLLTRNADGSGAMPGAETLEAVEYTARLAGTASTPLSARYRPAAAKADWRIVLQSLVKSLVGDDMEYLSDTFDEFGVCEDLLSPKPRSKLCVLADESGSIEDKLYEQFLGELAKLSRYAEVYVSGFTDTAVFNAVPLKHYRRTMTGGTDVRAVYAQACRKAFDGIVVLTDGCLEFPKAEPKPTIWAMPQSFGRKREVLL